MKNKKELVLVAFGILLLGIIVGLLIFALADNSQPAITIPYSSENSSNISTPETSLHTNPPKTENSSPGEVTTTPPQAENSVPGEVDTTPPQADNSAPGEVNATTSQAENSAPGEVNTTPPQTDNSAPGEVDTTTQQAENSAPGEINTTPQSAKPDNQNAPYPIWQSDKIYVGGDIVIHDGKIYKAKWWTQNETPGQSDVWAEYSAYYEDTKTALPDNTTKAPSTTKAPDKISGGGDGADIILPENFRVLGYYPSWYSSEDLSPALQLDKLSHIIYAFAIPTSDGGLRELESPEIARQLIEKGHAAGVKVMLAVGGWSYNDVPLEPVFMSATETKEKTDHFAAAIIKMCDDYGFDGIDMDWEHPRIDGTSYQQYEYLMLSLAEQLHAKNKLLSSAVLSGATPDGNIYYDAAAHTDKVLQAVDWINVMAYDGGDGERHSSYDFAVDSGEYWLSRGLSPEKINLGVPFYARPTWAAYRKIIEEDSTAALRDVSTFNGCEAYYNGIDTIKKKTTYAKNNLGGIMIWEITQDAAGEYSLLSAIADEIAGNS